MVSTPTEVLEALRPTQKAGTSAADARAEFLSERAHHRGGTSECFGGALLLVQIDGRSALGKMLSKVDKPRISVSKSSPGEYCIHLHYPFSGAPVVGGQEASIWHDATEGAAASLPCSLGVEAWARAYSN